MKKTEIQELIHFIAQSGLEEVHIETEGIKIHVKKHISLLLPPLSTTTTSPSTAPPLKQSSQTTAAETKTAYTTITSPMIGTFYRSPNPQATPFVQVGDMIHKGTTLCIIEAMKLFNEIEAEVSGKLIQILVDDISPVAYDQPLFVVDPTPSMA